MRVGMGPPNSPVKPKNTGWNSARPLRVSSTKQRATIR